jgi:hypothetical protein
MYYWLETEKLDTALTDYNSGSARSCSPVTNSPRLIVRWRAPCLAFIGSGAGGDCGGLRRCGWTRGDVAGHFAARRVGLSALSNIPE